MKSIATLSFIIFFTFFSYGQYTSLLKKVKPYSITFSVTNIDLLTNWYVEKLGFKVVQKKSYPQFKTSLAFLELNGYRVELIKDDNAKDTVKLRPDPPAHTSIHGQSQFCLYTDNLDGLEKELTARQIKIIWKFQNKELNVKFLFIRDPENNLIQFLQRLK
jgi:methylmalonyl-CoA/ethylmalonyl-CoA epimerase